MESSAGAMVARQTSKKFSRFEPQRSIFACVGDCVKKSEIWRLWVRVPRGMYVFFFPFLWGAGRGSFLTVFFVWMFVFWRFGWGLDEIGCFCGRICKEETYGFHAL